MRLIEADALNTSVVQFMAENAYLNMNALEVLKMVASWIEEAPTVNAPCWCKDCKWYDDESEVCVNPDSDWCADFPPQYGSCEHCKWRDDK